jgi:hypothetical protein
VYLNWISTKFKKNICLLDKITKLFFQVSFSKIISKIKIKYFKFKKLTNYLSNISHLDAKQLSYRIHPFGDYK